MRSVVAALLAVSMAIFPISIPQAAAVGSPEVGHHHAATAEAPHGRAHASVDCKNVSVDGVTIAGECSPQQRADYATGQDCCNMVCHFFQLSAAPAVAVPVGALVTLAMVGDEQVSGPSPSRLDRPPRTV